MSARSRAIRDGHEGAPSLSAGYLAALPLFLAYELGQALSAGAARAPAERVVALSLSVFEERSAAVRIALLLLCTALALLHTRHRPSEDEARRLGRLVAEGVFAGVLLGPLLTVLERWLWPEPLELAPPPARGLSAALRLIGAAPWEELLFRVGLYGGLFLLARRTSAFLGLESRAARVLAELAALLGSACLFAWFHLQSAQRLLGSTGESFHAGLFLWRVSAGILLGALFRWRGFGVAAWAHAVFNLGIALGLQA